MNKADYISLQDLKTGSSKVLEQVYKDNRTKFLLFARRYQLDENEIVDIYQDTYIAFYNNVMNGRLKELTSSVSTYLMSIGKHLILNKIKKDKKTVNPDFDITILRKELNDEIEIERDELNERQKLLRNHFTLLGNKCKELLTLFYYRGFSINDILEHSDYNSENVVKSAKSRCLKTLKERIKANAV